MLFKDSTPLVTEALTPMPLLANASLSPAAISLKLSPAVVV